MTPAELKNLITLDGDVLDLPVDVLGAPGISAFFGRFLPGGHLKVAGAHRTETPGGVTVVGTGTGAPFDGLAITAEFTAGSTAEGGQVAARITAVGQDNWSFATAFPKLRDTVFDIVRFAGPTLVLDSAALAGADQAKAAMTFHGTLVTGRLLMLDLLLADADHAVTGQITTGATLTGLDLDPTPAPDIVLDGPVGANSHLGLFPISELRYELFADPKLNLDTAAYDVEAYALVTGAVPFTAGGVSHQIPVSGQLFGTGQAALFRANLSELPLLGLSDLATFTHSSLAVPFPVKMGDVVRLTDVSMLVQPAAPDKIGYFSMKVEVQEKDDGTGLWQVVPDLITLQAIDIVFRVDTPTSPRVSGSLHGLVAIGDSGTLELGADFNTQTRLGGGLRKGDPPLSIREVYQHFTKSTDVSHLPDVAVDVFDFYVTLPGGGQSLAYTGAIRLEGDWTIIQDKLSLVDVEFALDHQNGTTTFFAKAVFVIHHVAIAVSAGYASAEGWRFTGETGPGQRIPLGELAVTLAQNFLQAVEGRPAALAVPRPIEELTIENLKVEFATKNRALLLTALARFPIDTVEVAAAITIDTAERSFGGRLAVTVPTDSGPFEADFDLHFSGKPEATRFAATYSHPTGLPPELKALVAAVSPSAADVIPPGIRLNIREAVFGYDKTATGTAYLFAIGIDATVDLSKLPVVGGHLKSGEMGLNPLRLMTASAAIPAADMIALNQLLPPEATKLPERDVASGFAVDAVLKLGPLTQPLAVPAAGAPPAPPTPTQAQTSDGTLWYKVQRSFGPISIERVGLAYRKPPGKDAELGLLLDASITVAGLTLSFDGLQVRLPIANLRSVPSFELNGLGLAYSSGPVQINGAFLKGTVNYAKVDYPAYSGKAVIRTSTLTLGAIGSYAELPGGPSLFVYAFLKYPIGGPPFFFVQGIAAGFGYNRRIIAPAVTAIADFPLVSEALGTRAPTTLTAEMRDLEKYLPPSPGDYFIAVGVHFSTFKMVDSFVLVTAGFGHRFELNVLGLATLTLPVADTTAGDFTPIAEVQLALKATFAPEDGVFSLTAQLTPNSFLLSRACHLTGGLAFVTWFGIEHTGDFVLTVGGYHPNFTVPKHYPTVPRLGFNWQVTPQLALKGSAYCALTPSMLMAGGSLSASFADDALRAWFDASMDFLIGWQPYHYEASFRVSVGASYTFSFFGTHTISARVGADVRIWGPEFTGTARIDLSVISFTISFRHGTPSLGDGTPPSAKPIPWDRFKATLLPAPAKMVTIAMRGGTAPGDQAGPEDLGVVNPAGLVLVTESVIPSSGGRRGPAAEDAALRTDGTATSFGIAPVGVASGVVSTHRVQITRDGVRADDLFVYTPVGKSLPYGLWGGETQPSLTHPQLVGDLLTGYEIRPVPPREPAKSASLRRDALRALTPLYTVPDAFAWPPSEPYEPVDADDPAARERLIAGTVTAPDVAATRSALVAAVLKDARVDLDGFDVADFREIPQVIAHG